MGESVLGFSKLVGSVLSFAWVVERKEERVGGLRALSVGDLCLVLLTMEEGKRIHYPRPVNEILQEEFALDKGVKLLKL